jgi:hypothetical protein
MVRQELKWSKTTGHRLISIAQDDRLAEVAHVLLPPSWGTLYQLTRLTDEQFQAGLDSGVIHAGMERKDVAKLKPKKEKPSREAAPKKELQECSAARRDRGRGGSPPYCLSGSRLVDEVRRADFFERLRAMIDHFEKIAADRAARITEEAA